MVPTTELDIDILMLILYTKFHFNMCMQCKENQRKLQITGIFQSPRAITLSKMGSIVPQTKHDLDIITINPYTKFHFNMCIRHVIYPAGFKFSRFGDPFPSAPLKIKISRRFKISKKKFERHISDFRMLTGKNPRLPKVCHFLLLICHRQLTLHTGLHRYCTVNTELSKISR
jgi:hypothetical protein